MAYLEIDSDNYSLEMSEIHEAEIELMVNECGENVIVYINKEHAEKIIAHLQREFKIISKASAPVTDDVDTSKIVQRVMMNSGVGCCTNGFESKALMPGVTFNDSNSKN